MARVAVVTGANKGIGFEIVRSLAGSAEKLHLIVACRNAARGEEAVAKLQQEFPKQSFQFGKLDLSEAESMKTFSDSIASEHGKIDILVHNAAIAFKQSDPTPFKEQARPTMLTNYFGTTQLNNLLLGLIQKSEKPNIVLVASQVGTSAFKGCSSSMKERWKMVKTETDITTLVNEFVQDVEAGNHKAKGWPSSCYGISKLAVIALGRVLAASYPDIKVNAVCPGWCATDMSSNTGSRTASKGAETPAYLALHGNIQSSGDFWYDKKQINFL